MPSDNGLKGRVTKDENGKEKSTIDRWKTEIKHLFSGIQKMSDKRNKKAMKEY